MQLVIEHVKCETELRLALVYSSKCSHYRFTQGYYDVQSPVHVDPKRFLQRNLYIQQIGIYTRFKTYCTTMVIMKIMEKGVYRK